MKEDAILKEESFRTGELCALLGVTPGAIRKYEKLIRMPVRRQDNGYRYYYLNDLQSLLHMRMLERLGYPLKEAAGLSIDADYGEKLTAGEKHLEKARKELRMARLRLRYEEEMQECLAHLQDEDGRYSEAVRPAFWWITCTREFLIRAPEKFRP